MVVVVVVERDGEEWRSYSEGMVSYLGFFPKGEGWGGETYHRKFDRVLGSCVY